MVKIYKNALDKIGAGVGIFSFGILYFGFSGFNFAVKNVGFRFRCHLRFTVFHFLAYGFRRLAKI